MADTVGGLGGDGRVALDPRPVAGALAASSFSFEGEDRVDGALLLPGEVAHHVDDRLQVLPHEGLRLGHALDAGELAERDLPAQRRVDAEGEAALAAGPVGGGEARRGREPARARRGPSIRATSRPAPGPASVSTAAIAGMPLRPAFSRSTLTSTRSRSASIESWTSTTPVRRLEEPADRPRHVVRAASRRAVDLGHQRVQDRRPGRDLHHLHARPAPPARSPTRAGRTRLAMSWLCAWRSCFGERFTCRSAPGGGTAAGSSGGRGR